MNAYQHSELELDASAETDAVPGEQHQQLLGQFLLGKWRLDRLLGHGGMSAVYLATHRNGSQVAIKVLHADYSGNTTMQRRFLREGYIANRVDHPGAVRVLDDGNDQGRAFLVMELLKGQDLERLRRARGGMLEPNQVAWLARQVLQVLSAAHGAGVIHRDIKPQNLFLTEQGQLKLLDFGIASLRGVPGFSTLTEASALPGTPGYMAPEQIRGLRDEVGPHTDIWSLGATLFRMLTGQTVHQGSTPGEMMVATATEAVRSVAEVRAGVPAGLASIVDKALAKDVADRWASAEQMLQALDGSVAELPSLEMALLPEIDDAEATWQTRDFESSPDAGLTGDAGGPEASHERPKRRGLDSGPERARSWRWLIPAALALLLTAAFLRPDAVAPTAESAESDTNVSVSNEPDSSEFQSGASRLSSAIDEPQDSSEENTLQASTTPSMASGLAASDVVDETESGAGSAEDAPPALPKAKPRRALQPAKSAAAAAAASNTARANEASAKSPSKELLRRRY